MIKQSGVYRIRNTVTDECYIGRAANIPARWVSHRLVLKSNSANPLFQAAYDKYGEWAFVYEVLIICAPADLLMFESRAIAVLKPEYNMRRISSAGRLFLKGLTL